MPNETKFTATTGNAEVSGTLRDKSIVFPTVPPVGITSVGPRVTFNFITEEWSNTNEYQYYDVVNISGASYVARQNVPTGIDISNEDYWFRWNDPNAEFQELENIVHTYDGRITDNAEAVAAEKTRAQAAESANTQAIEDEKTRAQAAESANTQAIENEKTRATGAETNLEETKAVKNHASADTTYGAATDALYGHVKLYNTINDKVDGALTPNAVQNYISTINTPYNAKCFLFGDSNGTATHLPGNGIQYYMKQIYNMNVTNYSVNGATFQTGIDNAEVIKNEISKAPSDPDVSYVIIIGGINDFHYGWSNIGNYINAVKEAVNAACEKYERATVILTMDMGKQYPNFVMLSMCRAMATATYSRPIQFISIADMCLNTNNFYNQNHYSAMGYEKISQRIATAMSGHMVTGAESTNNFAGVYDDRIRNYNSVSIDPYDVTLTSIGYIYFDTGFFTKTTEYKSGTKVFDYIGCLPGTQFYAAVPALRSAGANQVDTKPVSLTLVSKYGYEATASNNPTIEAQLPYDITPNTVYGNPYRAFYTFDCSMHATYIP